MLKRFSDLLWGMVEWLFHKFDDNILSPLFDIFVLLLVLLSPILMFGIPLFFIINLFF